MKSKNIINMLVILLTMTSGCADAISFLALGQVLTAAMTGNTVFLGLSFVHADGLKSIGYVVALSGFILGVAGGALILKKKRHISGLNPEVTFAFFIEFLAIILFGCLISFIHSPNQLLLTLILSFAMGVQGVTARRLGVNGVPTTVITSTTTGLIEALVWHTKTLNSSSSSAPLGSILIWAIDIAIYGVGAALCGAAELKWHMHAIWLPATIVFIVALVSFVFQLQAQYKNKLGQESSLSS